MKNNEYKCENCGNVYEKGWSDDEAKKEAELYFGKHPDNWNDRQAVVCDDCYTLMFPPMHPDLIEKVKKII